MAASRWASAAVSAITLIFYSACAPNKVEVKAPPFFKGVGMLPGGTPQSMVEDVTSQGPAAVGSSGYRDIVVGGTTSHHQGKPFRWLLSSGITELPSFSVVDSGGAALAISEPADVMVGYGYVDNGYKGLVWSAPDFAGEVLPPLPGYLYSRVVDYSEGEEISVGYCQHTPSSSTAVRRGCLWTRLGAVIQLSENLPDALSTTSWVTAVSHSGNAIVGKMAFTAQGYWRPVVWRKSGVPPVRDPGSLSTDPTVHELKNPKAIKVLKLAWKWAYVPIALPLLPETSEGQASDVSGDGKVIVGSCVAADGNYIPCKWVEDASGAFVVSAISGLPDVGTGDASAVSGDGSVIVGYTSEHVTTPEEDYIQQAWIWSTAKGGRRLAEALTSDGVTGHQGWSRLQPQGISSDGFVVGGFGTNPKNDQEGWVARLAHP